MKHILKTDPAVFQAVSDGAKTYEIRLNDRGFSVGDELLLRETTHTGAEIACGAALEYTGREITKHVSHVLDGYGLQDGWVILSFSEHSLSAQDEVLTKSNPQPTYAEWRKVVTLVQKIISTIRTGPAIELALQCLDSLDAWSDEVAAAPSPAVAVEPVALSMETIVEAAKQSGFERSASCCMQPLKFCAGDEWEGNLEGFAKALLRLASPSLAVRE